VGVAHSYYISRRQREEKDLKMNGEDKLKAARELLGKGEFSAAAKAYQAILDSGATATEVRPGLTKSLYGAGRCDEAAKAYQEIADSDKTLEVRLDLAEFLYGAGRYDEAAKAYQAILDSGTPPPKARLGLAKSLHGADKYDEAAEAYQAVIDSGTNSLEVGRWKGNCLWDSGRVEEALTAYQAALTAYQAAAAVNAKDPKAASIIYSDLGDCFYQLRRFREAIENYEKAAAPYSASAERATAEAVEADKCSSEEKKEEARIKREEARKAFRVCADWCIDLGYCYLGLKDYDKAVEVLKFSVDKASEYPLAHHALASVFWTQGNYEDAITEWNNAKLSYQNCEAQMLENGWEGWFLYEGTLLHEVFGDLNEAERVYKAAMNISKFLVRGWAGLAALYVERQDCPKERNKAGTDAQRAYRKAKELIKSRKYSDVENLLMVGELQLLMEDYDAARTSLTMALQKDEAQEDDDRYMRTAKPNTDLGILCMRTKECKQAIRHFEKAMKIDLTDLALRSNLAEAYLRDERLDDAQREFLRVLKTAPDHIESKIGLGAVYSALGDAGDTDMYEAAVAQYSAALNLAERKAGSKRLKDAELAKVRYSRGYAYVKAFEAAASPKDRRRLYDARVDFRECLRLDGEQHKAQRAVEKIEKVLPRRSPQRIMEDWIPSLIFVLSLGVFLEFQISLIHLPSWLRFLTPMQPIPPSEYITVTLGSFLFMVASCYLPQLLKLKVPGIELEKTAVDQITTLGPVGISKPT
jgi:tetratricopeptide (TPR) repeat protein